jgi:hypothetical protein
MFDRSHLVFSAFKGIRTSNFNVFVDQPGLLEDSFYGVCHGDNEDSVIYSLNESGFFSIYKDCMNGDGSLSDSSFGMGEHFMNGSGMCSPIATAWVCIYEQ